MRRLVQAHINELRLARSERRVLEPAPARMRPTHRALDPQTVVDEQPPSRSWFRLARRTLQSPVYDYHSSRGLVASTAVACRSSQQALQPSSSTNLASARVKNSASS